MGSKVLDIEVCPCSNRVAIEVINGPHSGGDISRKYHERDLVFYITISCYRCKHIESLGCYKKENNKEEIEKEIIKLWNQYCQTKKEELKNER